MYLQVFLRLLSKRYELKPYFQANQKELTPQELPILKIFDALIVAKTLKAFSENDKLILDQYIMQCGKILWMLNTIHAEMDRASTTMKKIPAYPLELNLTDLFFKYSFYTSDQSWLKIYRPLPYG
ncbi:MAG: Gldg family protein [Flavobacteriales bacterium AspAUS03]